MIKKFNKMLAETFDERCDIFLYTLRHHLLDHMGDDVRRSRALSVLGSRPYEHFDVHIRHAFRATLYRSRTQMMETVHLMEQNYGRALP